MMTVPRQLRDALRFAVDVARDGELADPPIPAPVGMRRFLTFRRLSASSNSAIAAILEADEEFRSRVAEHADEEEIGRAGWLWLARPEGWEEAFTRSLEAGPEDPEDRAALLNKLKRAREGAEAAAERARGELEEMTESRDRLAERLSDLERRRHDEDARMADLTVERDSLRAERNAAMRDLKRVEAEAAELRRDLRTVREALREAEVELSELRRTSSSGSTADAGAVGSAGSEGSDGPTGTEAPDGATVDRHLLGEMVSGAAAAAEELAGFLADAGRLLADPEEADEPDEPGTHEGPDRAGGSSAPRRSGSPDGGPSRSAAPSGNARASRRASARTRRSRRRAPELPFGVTEPSDRATAAFLADPRNLVIVDGYNLARAVWSDAEPEEERRWVVSLLEEAAARGGVEIHVVFDGRDDAMSPTASRTVRVGYSPTGVTADDVILEMLGDLPPGRPVVVVTSDREIVDGARSEGSVVVGSADFARVVRG